MRSEQELLLNLQRGDPSAWEEYVHIYGKQLYNYLYNQLPTVEDIEDVMSETMAASVSALQRFDGKVPLRTFLFSIANHKMVDYWRKHKRTKALDDSLDDSLVDKNNDLEIMDFRDLLDKLPENYRQVLLLRYHMGMSVSEIAEINKSSYKSAESLLTRARNQLHLLLTESTKMPTRPS